MQASSSLRIPDDAEATISITAKIGDLKKLRKQLHDPQTQGHWPIQTFVRQVDEAIFKAERTFCTQSEEAPK